MRIYNIDNFAPSERKLLSSQTNVLAEILLHLLLFSTISWLGQWDHIKITSPKKKN